LSGRYGLILGDYVEIGPRITMLTCSDDFKGLSMVGPCIQDEFKPQLNFGKIILERHVVIGAHSVILPGVTIGEGAAVGAMSFVTKSLDPWGIYAGIPVKRIGDRSKSILDLQVAFEESRR
jgi:galactoside O-acetyltransferase